MLTTIVKVIQKIEIIYKTDDISQDKLLLVLLANVTNMTILIF